MLFLFDPLCRENQRHSSDTRTWESASAAVSQSNNIHRDRGSELQSVEVLLITHVRSVPIAALSSSACVSIGHECEQWLYIYLCQSMSGWKGFLCYKHWKGEANLLKQAVRCTSPTLHTEHSPKLLGATQLARYNSDLRNVEPGKVLGSLFWSTSYNFSINSNVQLH